MTNQKDDNHVDLSEEEIKIMQEVKKDEKWMEKSGIEKVIKKLIDTPNLFDKFNDVINKIEHTHPDILNEFSNKYVLFKKYPENDRYKTDFFVVLQRMNEMDALAREVTTQIQTETQKINTMVDSINGIISVEKKDNRLLKRELQIVDQEIYGSHEMIGDFVDEYKRIRFYNLLMLVGTIYLLVFVCYFIYRRWTGTVGK